MEEQERDYGQQGASGSGSGRSRKFFRRKKRFQGATWTPPSMSAEPEDGLWCRACKQRHGYMVLAVAYEKNNRGQWVIVWSCPRTGNVVGDTTLGGARNE